MKQLSNYLYVSSLTILLLHVFQLPFTYTFPVGLILLVIAVMIHLLVDYNQSNIIYIILDLDNHEIISSHKTLEDCLNQYKVIIKNHPKMYMKVEACALN